MAATAASGDVVFVVDEHMSTLMDFRYKKKYVAENGSPGGGKSVLERADPT